jgi:phenylalanyl-tRNA synthetase beta chain
VLRRANCLRQSLAPSLLAARRTNETLFNPLVELFEIANVYLPRPGQLPDELRMLGVISCRSFAHVKGTVEALVAAVAPGSRLESTGHDAPLFEGGRGCQLRLEGNVLGYLGEVSRKGLARFELRGKSTLAELDLGVLIDAAVLIRRAMPLSPYPPVGRDLNLVVDEQVRWADVERIVHDCGGDLLESIAYQETYRHAERLGAGKKSLLFSIQLRSAEGTLTNEQADAVRDKIVAAASRELGAELRA